MSNLDLPALGVASYSIGSGAGETFTFNGATLTNVYQVEPKKDAAGRTFVSADYTLTLETYLDVGPNEQSVLDAVALLSQPGGQLVYTGHGVGAMGVNTGELENWDTNWGPFPQSCRAEIHGGVTTKLTWTVKFSQPTCDDRVTRLQVMEYVYSASVDLDGEGYSVRNIKGFLRIPMTRLAPLRRSLPDSADFYRDQAVPPIPVGFTRMNQHFETDYSKNQLNFSFTDHQMNPNFPAQGVLSCLADQTWQGEGKGELLKWTSTINASYTCAPGVGMNIVAAAFLDLTAQRRSMIAAANLGEGLIKAGAISAGDPTKRPPIILLRISFAEPNIYGPGQQKARCSCTYFVANVGLSAILNKGGLWQPVTSGGAVTTWKTGC